MILRKVGSEPNSLLALKYLVATLILFEHLFYCTLKIDVKIIYYLESVSFNSHRPRYYSSKMWTDVYNSLRHLAHAELGKLDKSNRSTSQNILTHKTIKTTGKLKNWSIRSLLL